MLILAALILGATGLAHSYLGERYLLVRLFRREGLPKLCGGTEFTVGTLRFAWHLTTVAWWTLGVVLILAADGPLSVPTVVRVIGMAAIVSAVLPIYFTRGRHLSWIAFGAVAALAFLAA